MMFVSLRTISLSAIIGCLTAATILALTGCSGFFGDRHEMAQPRPQIGRAPIMGKGIASSQQMAKLLRRKNKNINYDTARNFAALYIEESRAEGVNADVAFVQMCLETDFLRFGGQVQARQNNFCGLGATDDGAEGATFPSVRAGVRAHIQHLKAYASRAPTRNPVIDPRFDLVKRGSAPYVQQLAGAWATDPDYAIKLKRLLARLKQT